MMFNVPAAKVEKFYGLVEFGSLQQTKMVGFS